MKNEDFSMLSKKIAQKIKLERTKRNLSQEDLAFAAGLSKNSIWKIETNQVSPKIDSLEKIAKAFGMNLISLIDVSHVDLD